MKSILCLSMTLIGMLASVATASAFEDNTSRVTTSRSLRVASVRVDDDAPWYIMQQAFSTSMSACLAGKDLVAMPVKIDTLSASSSADALLNGQYDAVLVLGERVPSELRSNKFTSVRAVSQVGTPVRVFHFVLRSGDPAMNQTLITAFEKATASASFQDTIGRASAVRVVANNSNL
jgi:hypothetical protein